jgi:tetrahydromethanopterin S-methyltransferase subunit G
MELDELKSAWSKFASSEEKKRVLTETELSSMMTTQTRDITQKIGRNIRIGVGIILAWVVLGILTNLVVSVLFKKVLDKPYLTESILFWSYCIEMMSYVLILATIIVFWIKYSKIEKTRIDASNLRETLSRLIGIVSSYKRMFYVVFGIFLFFITVSFSSGFFLETNYQVQTTGIDFSSLSLTRWILMIFVFIVTLGLFWGAYYLLFNLFFKRLYGRYLETMKATLKELDEVNL